MPTSEAPAEVNEPKGPAEPSPQKGGPAKETSIAGSIWGWTRSLSGIWNRANLLLLWCAARAG